MVWLLLVLLFLFLFFFKERDAQRATRLVRMSSLVFWLLLFFLTRFIFQWCEASESSCYCHFTESSLKKKKILHCHVDSQLFGSRARTTEKRSEAMKSSIDKDSTTLCFSTMQRRALSHPCVMWVPWAQCC